MRFKGSQFPSGEAGDFKSQFHQLGIVSNQRRQPGGRFGLKLGKGFLGFAFWIISGRRAFNVSGQKTLGKI